MDSKKHDADLSGRSDKLSQVVVKLKFLAEHNRVLGIAVVVLLWGITLLHLVGFFLYWYWLWDSFDVILHFLGGGWVGLVFLYYFPPLRNKLVRAINLFGFVALVAVLWEFFEVGMELAFGNNPFTGIPGLAQDTMADLFLGLLGAGVVTILYFALFRNKVVTENNEIHH